MTESEWHSFTDPTAMLAFLRGKASDRKLRLFMCACCRRVWDLIQEPYCRVAVEVTEKYLEGEATSDAFDSAADNVDWAWSLQRSDGCIYAEEAAMYPTVADTYDGVFWCMSCLQDSQRPRPDAEAAAQALLLRDIFNPFALPLDPGWQTPTVLTLAQGIYTDLAFDRLPILADAVADAGCSNDDLLNHCRSETAHTRGCWAIDLLLGKK